MPWRQDFPFGPEYIGSRVPKRRIEKAKEGRKAVALAPLRMPCSLALQSFPQLPPNCHVFRGRKSVRTFFFAERKPFFPFFFLVNPLPHIIRSFSPSLSLLLSSFSLTFPSSNCFMSRWRLLVSPAAATACRYSLARSNS